MSFKKNIVANYIAQIFNAAIGILILPLYIKNMGAEAYGLVGFFTMLQAWFGVLDMGLTPTVGRETARYFGGSISALQYRKLFRALTLIFLSIGLLGGGGLFFSADFAATKWLKVKELSTVEVVFAVKIMAISVALRWVGGLYRGVIFGAERLVWLSGFTIGLSALRFVAVNISMYFFGFTPRVFFIHQFFIAILECLGLLLAAYKLLPSKNDVGAIGWSFKPITSVLGFSLGVAFSSTIWVSMAQLDKLILSGILPLAEYGYFAFAVLAASGIAVLGGPIGGAALPRMTRLYAMGQYDEMIRLYRNSTQLVTIAVSSSSLLIAFFSQQVLFIWTGNREISSQAASVLRLYALGNAILAIGSFPYYLQYAFGTLKCHLVGSVIMVVALIPSIVWVTGHFGGVGAGAVWLVLNFLYFIFWVSYSHYKLVPGLHLRWLMEDVLIICLSVTFTMWCLSELCSDSLSKDRWDLVVEIMLAGVISLLVALVTSSAIRGYLAKKIDSF